MAEAHAAGVPPDRFWHLTYREVYAAISGAATLRRRHRQDALWAAWHGESFARNKRLPNIANILRKMEPSKEMTVTEIRASVHSMALAMGAEIVHVKRSEL